jgi:Ring finger domain
LESEESHGLDESTIKLIPTVSYQKPKELGVLHVCAVCLTEFKEGEKTRVLPNCLHFFHVNCIDEWLCKNANCPLCRSPITTEPTSFSVNQELDHVVPENNTEVVINVREDEAATTDSTLAAGGNRSSGKWSCRGDESIELRREKQLAVVPMRRSFSVDSSADRWLSREVQKLLQQNRLFHVTPLAHITGPVPKITLPMDLQWILNTSSS